MCKGCQEYLVRRKVQVPTVATGSRTMVWVEDLVDSHGQILERTILSIPETEFLYTRAA